MFPSKKDLKLKFLSSTRLRLKSVKDGKLRTGPEFVRFGISRSCNFNCLTCWHHSPLLKEPKSATRKRVKMNKKIVFDTLDYLAEMNCMGVLFSGAGEPFIYPNIMEFIRKAKEKGLLVRIQTNLSLIKSPHDSTSGHLFVPFLLNIRQI